MLTLCLCSSAGWTSYHVYKGSTERDRNVAQTKLSTQLKSLLDKVRASEYSWPFVGPVSQKEVS